MGWEGRGGRRYYYEKERRDGRVVSVYRGSGPVAVCAAQLGRLGREERLLRKFLLDGERAASDEAEASLVRLGRVVESALHDALARAGYHRINRGPWRRRRMSHTGEITKADGTKQPAAGPGLPSGAEREALFDRARKGDRSCLPQLRAVLDAEPATVGEYGNIRRYARRALIDLATKPNDGPADLALVESMGRMIDRTRADLEGPEPTAMESMLASRAALDWFAVHLFEFFASSEGGRTIAQAAWHQKRLDRAHARFLASLRALAQVKRLLRKPAPAVQITAVNAQALFGSGALGLGSDLSGRQGPGDRQSGSVRTRLWPGRPSGR